MSRPLRVQRILASTGARLVALMSQSSKKYMWLLTEKRRARLEREASADVRRVDDEEGRRRGGRGDVRRAAQSERRGFGVLQVLCSTND